MSKKNKPEEIPSWIKDLYKEDLDRVVKGERPMYFRGMDDSPLRNVSPEFDILSGRAAVKGINGIRSTLSPLNNGMGNYNFSIRGINKKIGELVDEAGLYLPEKLRPVYRTVVDAMSSSKDKGLGHITQPLANALYPADERRNRRLDGEYPVGYVDAIDGIWPREKYGLWGEKIERKADEGEVYTVSKGDTLWGIAKRLGLSLDDIASWNRDIPDINKIQIGDKIRVSDPSLSIEKEDHDLMEMVSRETEINRMSDEDIIKSANHKSNYAIVDKKNKKLTVYSPHGDILYSTNNIGTGASGDDYNTYTKTKNGKLVSGAGNMSTPAGITRVSGIGEYHGRKSFQRARFNPKTGKWDHDIASSMHHEASAGRGSNGCIRLLGDTGNELYNFIKKGDFIYTLPEKEGSRFVIREGSINYIADNPYGEDSGEKKLWDDYNVHINKDFRPLNISIKNSDISPDVLPKWIYDAYDPKDGTNSNSAFLGVISAIDNIAKMDKLGNMKEYGDAISSNKERIMSEFGIDSYTYDRMAMLAMGIAEQETKFGVSPRYIGKQAIGDFGVDIAKRFRSLLKGDGWNDRSYNSKGITQIKMDGDNDETRKVYDKFGIDKENILKPYNSGIATMLRLASIYKNEVVGRGFKDNKGNDIDKFDALLYKWMGKGRLLNNGKASPDDNDYINNVKKYIGNFDFKVKYKDGGPIGDDPLYVRQDVSDKASYLKDILGNAIRRRLYENVTPDVVASNASLPDKVNEFIYGRNGKVNVDGYSDQLWARFLSQPNNLDGNNKEIRIPDNVIADIEKMFNRDTKDEIKRLDKKIYDTEQKIYGSDTPAPDELYGKLEFLKKSREWVDIFEKNRNSVRSGKPTVFSEYDFYPEAAGELTPLSGLGNFTIYRRPDGRLGVYDVYDFYSDDQEFPVNIATKTLDAIGDKFEERGSFKDYNPAPESGKDALIRNAITSKNKLEDKQEGGYIDDDYDIEWIVGESIPSNISIKKYIGGGGINEDSNIPEDDLRRLYSDDLKKVINGDKAVYFGNLNDKPVHNVHPELFLFPAINAMMGAVDSIDDIRKGRYSDVVVDIAMGFLPDVLRKVSKKAIRGVIDSVVSSDLFSSVFLEKKRGQDIVNTLMRNKEWSNFLNGINGDNYYRLQKKKGAESYMDDEKLFVSHTTPWEEFIPDGSKGTSHKFLYELPTSLLGRRYGSNDKGYIGDTMVDEMGFNHLMYGNKSSGRRGFVRVIDDGGAQEIGIDPYIIGISDRPLNNRGFYDNYPYYENVLQGNQTIVKGDELKDVLINGTYNLYERTRNGIQKTIHVGDGKGGLIQRKDDGGQVESGRDYGSGKYVIDPRRLEDSRMAVYDEIWDYLTEKKGIPQTQAIGILSNIAAESGGDTTALGAAGDFGIQQWLGPRKKELQRRYGKKPTLTQQLDYLVDEYQGKVPGLGWNYINQGKFFDKDAQGNVYNYYMYSKSDFDNAVNYKDATVAWNQGYGRPLGSTLRNEKRFEFADMFANRYGVPETEPMRYEFGQRDSGTGDGGQRPVPEKVAPADPSLASRPSMDSWWEKEGQDLLYKMLAQSGANKKAIEDIANNIKDDPQSEAQIAEAERMRKEQAKRQLVLNMIPGLSLNIKGMSRTRN